MKNTDRQVLSLAGIASPSPTTLKLVAAVDCGFKAARRIDPQTLQISLHQARRQFQKPRRRVRRTARGSAGAAKNLGIGVLAARPAKRITEREAKKAAAAGGKIGFKPAFKLALSDAVGWLYSREIYRGAL